MWYGFDLLPHMVFVMDHSDCSHKWKTTDSVSRGAHKRGERKFSGEFKLEESAGISAIAVRRKICELCGDILMTVEVSREDLRRLTAGADIHRNQ